MRRKICFFVLCNLINTAFAALPCKTQCFEIAYPWHFVAALGGGIAASSDVGKSQNFPIVNPLTDQFYNYAAQHDTQRAGIGDVFIGEEWLFNPQWSLQFGIGYTQIWDFSAKGTLIQGADALSQDQYQYQYTVSSRQWFLESKLLSCVKQFFHPYVLVGLGVAYNNAENFTTTVPPFLTFTREYQNHAESNFTYLLGIGVDADIAEHVRFGLSYRFTNIGKVRLGQARIDTTPVNGTLSQNNLYVNALLAQVSVLV